MSGSSHAAAFIYGENGAQISCCVIWIVLLGLMKCFRNFSPPLGLALDFAPTATNPDDLIRNFFIFSPPSQLVRGSVVNQASQTSFAEMTADEDAQQNTERMPPAADQEEDPRPLRTVHSASSASHVLAHIIKDVYSHFRGPTCLQAAKRLDGVARLLLRNNSKAALMEPLLVFSLVQGNAASALRFYDFQSSLEGTGEDQLQLRETPQTAASSSLQAGIYDPTLMVSYFDIGTKASTAKVSSLVADSLSRPYRSYGILTPMCCLHIFSVKSGYTSAAKKFEKYLGKRHDERVVGRMLFGNSLANPSTHEKITDIGSVVGFDEGLLKDITNYISHQAIDIGDAISILMPHAPNTAAFVRGTSFYVFESVFMQNGEHTVYLCTGRRV